MVVGEVIANTTNVGRRIFASKQDVTKVIMITFIAFLFSRFQVAIYGMLSVPLAAHFDVAADKIIFLDGFGLWSKS